MRVLKAERMSEIRIRVVAFVLLVFTVVARNEVREYRGDDMRLVNCSDNLDSMLMRVEYEISLADKSEMS